MGRSVVSFGFILKSKFLTRFDVFFEVFIVAYFNAISIDFYAVKCFICIMCNFHVYKWEKEGLYERLKKV